MNKRPCLVDICDSAGVSKGYCGKHYQRLRRYGDPTRANKINVGLTLEERLQNIGWTVDINGCWLFAGNTTENGYGTLYYNKKNVPAHRVAYTVWNGDIPDGFLIRHKCDNRLCINPGHLETGTHSDNMSDMMERGRVASTLNNDVVRQIRDSTETLKTLAAVYGVTVATVRKIKQRKTWRWVD